MPIVICPTCEKSFEFERSCAAPFCSRRCQQIDLGRWLFEQNSISYIREDADEFEEEAFEEEYDEPINFRRE